MRQPIVVVLGHVDHGKTQLLDFLRRSRVQKKEAGGITQHIGATEVPADYIKKFCRPVLDKLGVEVKVPGLLFVDTPGHAAFSNLRRRGGSVADLAVLVIDITAGVQPQTVESIEILKQFKVPFIVAANKVDLVDGYTSREGSFLSNVKKQDARGTGNLETKLYETVGKLSELGFESERLDRISSFTDQVVIVPTSAETGEGVVDLIALLAGLAQKYLGERLETTGRTRGNILEIKQERGLGATADAIVYDGVLCEGDTIVVAGVDAPIVTKVRSLLKPAPLKEIRAEKKFKRVKEVRAASGVKIAAPDLDRALAGSSIIAAGPDGTEGAVREIEEELRELEFSTDKVGVVVKTDTLGTLEALVKMLQERGVPVRMARVGDVTKSDIVEAGEVAQSEPFMGAVLGFNAKNTEPGLADEKGVKVITGNIVYRIIEAYEEWVESEKQRIREKELSQLPRPAKFRVVPGCAFRTSKPMIVGVEVLGGSLRNGVEVMREDGKVVGEIKQLEVQGKCVKEACQRSQLAVSIDGPTLGRQVKEEDTLWVSMKEPEYKRLKGYIDLLSESEREVLQETLQIKRKERKTWGMLDFS